jgi:hypothetical protein
MAQSVLIRSRSPCVQRGQKGTLQIEAKILRYVAQHPAAKDTAEGIAQWWLLGSREPASVAEVKAGLEGLVAQGRLAAEQQADGSVFYCRPKAVKPADEVFSGAKQVQEKLNHSDDGQRSKQPRQR